MLDERFTSGDRQKGGLRPARPVFTIVCALVLSIAVFAVAAPNGGDVYLSADAESDTDSSSQDELPETAAAESAPVLRVPGADGDSADDPTLFNTVDEDSDVGTDAKADSEQTPEPAGSSTLAASSDSIVAPAESSSSDDNTATATSSDSGRLRINRGNGRSNSPNDSDSSTSSTTQARQATTTTQAEQTTTTTRPTTTSTTRATTTTRPTTTTTQATTTTRPTTTTTRPTTTTTRPTTSTTNTTVPVNGPVVWVDSRAASGGDGSQARPYRTVNEGVLGVGAGETLMIKGGEYREFVNPGYRMPKGTASAPITMTNAPGERVVIRGRVVLTDIEYWSISGMNVTWDNERNGSSVEHMVMLFGGHNWEFKDAEVWGAKAFSAILVGENPRNFALRNLHIHDTYPTNDTNQDHLIYCACGTGGGVIERNLLVGSANGRAIKVGTPNNSGGSIGNVAIRYNTMVDNLGPSNVQLSYNTSNITVERNIMVTTADYAANLSTYQLSGSNNRAANNIGFDSPIGVVENHSGIIDGGGNIYRDPRLDSNYVPQDSASKAYGHKAP